MSIYFSNTWRPRLPSNQSYCPLYVRVDCTKPGTSEPTCPSTKRKDTEELSAGHETKDKSLGLENHETMFEGQCHTIHPGTNGGYISISLLGQVYRA